MIKVCHGGRNDQLSNYADRSSKMKAENKSLNGATWKGSFGGAE